MSKPDGGPAFPREGFMGPHSWVQSQSGMTLRDYFAAKAMQGHLSNPTVTEHPAYDREGLVRESYAIADAMLKEKEKP